MNMRPLTVATGLAVGTLVGLRTARRGLAESLRAGSGIARATNRLRTGLVVSEIALSATLLVGALLLVRSVMNLQSMRLGFDARNLFGSSYSLRGPAFGSPAERADFIHRLVDGARGLPGVASATLADKVPPRSGFFMGTLETPERLAGRVELESGAVLVAQSAAGETDQLARACQFVGRVQVLKAGDGEPQAPINSPPRTTNRVDARLNRFDMLNL